MGGFADPFSGSGAIDTGAILQWLQQMVTQRMLGQVQPGTGGMPQPQVPQVGPPGAGAPGIAAPQVGPPGPPQGPMGPGAPLGPPQGPMGLGAPQPFPQPFALNQVPPGGGVEAFPQPQSKTDQDSGIQFAWGGNQPQDYQPGVTDILEMAGAPPRREGLGGAAPVAGGMEPGGYGASAEWEDVANPQGFDAFVQAPGVEETLRLAQDPMYREREQSAIEQEGALGTGKELMRYQSEIEAQAAEGRREAFTRDLEEAVMMLMAEAETNGREVRPEELQQLEQRIAMMHGFQDQI